jgi:opacity protein-like surface antigen
MKRMLIGIAAVASLLSTGAFAADLAPYTKAAPVYVAPVYNWTGFYIGGNVGYSWGRSRDTSTLSNGAGTILFTDTLRSNMDGVIGGAQMGYNWQMSNWLVGLEAIRVRASAGIIRSSARPVSARRRSASSPSSRVRRLRRTCIRNSNGSERCAAGSALP